ncbi:MAG: VacB/RNase II family 3'-5' exoribonuclease [Planctomycetes bacterium]|nr:VacB/RNase II family 3'-5' exoribonuclease [Planctomycetota bacterium]
MKRASARPATGRGSGGKQFSPYVGRVEKVLERKRTRFVGTLIQHGPYWLVEVDGNQLGSPIHVRDIGAKDANENDKVLAEVIEFPEPGDWAEGVIIKRLGEAGRPDVETESVILAYNLPGDFTDDCDDQAGDIARRFADADQWLDGREDLRDLFAFTIDPPDARDFDDAISINKLDGRNNGAVYELGVHIADVSAFVNRLSPLDVEASERGNSVYLPRLVIPMIPEVLSNGVCSLQEGVDRLTKSVFMRFDKDGKVVGRRYCRSVIKSNKRLTYLEAEALLRNDEKTAKENTRSESGYSKELKTALKHMAALADILRQRRIKDGMISLMLPEVELIFDDDGHVIDAVPEDDASTHGLIEMFMVEANEAVATLFESLSVPVLRRTHPDPSTFDVTELRQFCRVAGVNIPKNPSRFELQTILNMTRDTPRQHAVHLAVLKSLAKAEYSPAMIGHFALASTHYAHFTSPIRRYPDLLVHRALDAWLDHTNNGRDKPKGKGGSKLGKTLRKDDRCPDEEELLEIGFHCSDTERNAEMAESSLRTFLVLQLLDEKHKGDTFDGVIVSVSNNAVWVQIDKYLVEGMVKTSDIPVGKKKAEKDGEKKKEENTTKKAGSPGRHKNHNQSQGAFRRRADRWQLNSDTGALVHDTSGRTINIGDRVHVQPLLIDPPARRLDLLITDFV